MQRLFFLRIALFATICLFHVSATRAAITTTGDVQPTNPATWTEDTDGYIGRSADGSLTVGSTSHLVSRVGYIGYKKGVNGTMRVDGTGAAWDSQFILVGQHGHGTLDITRGGVARSTSSCCIGGWGKEAKGIMTIDGVGSQLLAHELCVGAAGNGELRVTGGGAVQSAGSHVGNDSYYDHPTRGVATVDGALSKWTADYLSVGSQYGDGVLNISGGGTVAVTETTDLFGVATHTHTGTVNFGDGGGTLTTRSLIASPTQFTGTGTINSRGFVGDTDFVFDSTHGLIQSFTWNQPNQNVTLNLDMTGGNGWLGVGAHGNGSLTIRDGVSIASSGGYIGGDYGSTGVVTVDGNGSTWTSGGMYVGDRGHGTLNIIRDGTVNAGFCQIDGANSSVTVDGADSKLNCSWSLYIGRYFNNQSTLNIAGGAAVTVAGDTEISHGYLAGEGTLNFADGGGTLTTRSLLASPTQMTGTGTINTHGLVSDVDLVFDSTHGFSQTLTLNQQPGQNITLNVDLTSDPISNGPLGAGERGRGSLRIGDGVRVTSAGGWIGSRVGSKGVVTVDGPGSKWTNTDLLYVGEFGSGVLNITNGGEVENSEARIGYMDYSSGVVNVNGTGSKWINNGLLSIGGVRTDAILRIMAGGLVTAKDAAIDRHSLLAIHLSGGSRLNLDGGNGTISNRGLIRLIAGAEPAAGETFSPIAAKTWNGSGRYQSLGGTWNAQTHKFTASAVQTAASGKAVTIDLAKKQRIRVHDDETGWTVGTSFVASKSANPITFKATAIEGSTLTGLENLLDTGESVLGGWMFSATGGCTVENPAYLSFDVGSERSLDDLEVWQYNAGSWREFVTMTLNITGKYANFTIPSFGGYAITDGGSALGALSREDCEMSMMAQPAPEPGAIALLLTAAAAIAAWRRWKRT
jgi:T5SS/PEP-CTERM-associated repeat protein